MKCPKCAYLGFETGDRCKNCGYDFSLLSEAEASPDVTDDTDRMSLDEDYTFRRALDEEPIHTRDDLDDGLTILMPPELPLNEEPVIQVGSRFDDEPVRPRRPSAPAPGPAAAGARFMPGGSAESALPLFTPSDDEDDEPLIRMPAAPRAPLSVRRTPDTPRLRAVPRAVSGPPRAPVLQFSEEPVERAAGVPGESARAEAAPARAIAADSSRAGARLIAAAIDCAILLGIDLGVVYFTVRMAGLSMSEWNVLPLAPVLMFLALLKIAYFHAFTAVGGQTIGKMAVGTCVVAEDGSAVDAARALRRTLAGVLSVLLLGLGFVPALFGDRRALHDRLAGTRVVRLRSV